MKKELLHPVFQQALTQW